MVTITCDTCGAKRLPNTESVAHRDWIQGFDLLTDTPRVKQRAIRLLDLWDMRKIAEMGAIHFCSVECKDRYLALNAVA